MKLLRLVIAGFLALGITLVGVGTAQAYPTPVFSLTLSRHTVYGGETFDATVKANVTCSTWAITFLGQTVSGHDTDTFVHTFPTPKVTAKEVRPVTARCTYDSAAAGAGNAVRIVAAQSGILHSDVTILPRSSTGTGGVAGNGNGNGTASGAGSSSGSGLPNTGGPAFWIVLLALALVLGGGVAMARNRRASAQAAGQNPVPGEPTPGASLAE